MELAVVRRLFAGIIIIGTVGAETGLLVLNRFILSAGVYKLPYPITATLIQCFITFCLVRAGEILCLCFWPNPTSHHSVVLSHPDEEALLSQSNDAESDAAKRSAEPSPRSIERQGHSVERRFSYLAKITFVYLSRTALSNVNIVHLPLSTYTLFRLGAVPLAFLFNCILTGDSHSILAISSSFIGMFSLALNVLVSASPGTVGGVLLGVSLAVLDAMLPILLLDACFERGPRTQSQESILNIRDKSHAGPKDCLRLQDATRRFWLTLRQVSMLSFLALLPIFLLCGEPQDIRRNSYILDVSRTWILLISSGVVNALSLVFLALLAKTISPVTTTFLTVPSSSIIIVIFGGSLTAYGWISIGSCWAFSTCFILFQPKEMSTMAPVTRTTYSLIRSMFVCTLLFGCVYSIVLFYDGEFTVPHIAASTCGPYFDLPSNVSLPEAPKLPSNAKDGYLGPRPDVSTLANISLIIENCAEIANGSGVDDVVNCLTYLAEKEQEYLTLPLANSSQAGEQASRHSKNITSPESNVFTAPSTKLVSAQAASSSSTGTCPGKVIPFHVYWTGPASWRFELFVKAYLFTQNLPCSRLWIWLDEDIHPGAVDDMLCNDPIFQRFLPLVQRGDITVKSWKFPTRIPVPKETIDNTTGLYFKPHPSAQEGESYISDELIRDTHGNYFLAIDPTLGSITPVQISDAVRFIVLHLHGGIYCDMDVLLLRDMRPMLLPDPATGISRAFAEQWVERCSPSEYNTAVISLPANSSLSTYLLRGGVRMGTNFHPLVIGRMMWREGRNDELAMLHNAVFDPLVTNLRRKGTDVCTVPCHKNFKSAFMRVVEEPEEEWRNYYGERAGDTPAVWPPTNRSMRNFFRGAWAYHIHNQWWKFPEPTSWMDVITRVQDGFFEGTRTNAYGEMWGGPFVKVYDREGWH